MEYIETEVKVGDKVKPKGKFKKVVDFLASADKETLKILSTFFEGEGDSITDAKRLQKAHAVENVYKETLDVFLNRDEDVWEEKIQYWEKVTEEISDES